ncbi:hypothetical protein [[Eubacterium] cellulosolvens]
MREKAIVFATGLVIMFILSAGLPAVIAEASSEYSLKVDRHVHVGGWGLVTVNDTFTVWNNSTALLTDVPIGLPRNLTAGLRYLAARDDQNSRLTVERDLDSSSETYWFKVNFAKALAYNDNYTFSVTSLFTNVLVPVPRGFQIRFVTTPILRVRGTSEDLTITGDAEAAITPPQEFNFTDTSEGGRAQLSARFAPIEPYTTRSIVLYMESEAQLVVRVPHVSREIRFEEDGTIHVSDMYDFENLANSITTIQLMLPQNCSDIMAYDLIGPLWDSPEQEPRISITPRYSGGIGTNRTFTFTVEYQIDPKTYVKQVQWWGVNNYEFALLSNLKYWFIDKLETTVIVPSGFSVRSVSPSPSSTWSSLFYRSLRYEVTDVTPYTDLGLSLDYSYVPFWSGSPLLAWVAIIELVVAASVVVARMRKPTVVKIPVPSEKLKQFVELYDGRTALRLELDRMTQDLARGALNKHEYRRRRRTIELRMGELDRALQPLKQDLKAFHPRYAEVILRMEKAEAEIEANRLGEEHFRTQYRSGRISKEAYERTLEDLSRRVDKAREVIDTSLVTLREEAR